MRFFCLIIIAISLLVSGTFGLLTLKTQNEIGKLEEEKTAIEERNGIHSADIQALQESIDIISSEKAELEAELVYERKMASYKTEPTVFLTFDDGTSSNTHKILDILNEAGVKGTFFVVGSQIVNNGSVARDAVKRIVEEGHTLAIHCYNHTYSEIYKSKEAYFADFDKVVALLEEISGFSPNIVRLPSGTYSAKLFCKQYSGTTDTYYDIVSELYARGYEVIDWNIDTEDFTTATGVSNIVSNAISGAKTRLTRSYKTAVILMHDTADTYKALPEIISQLKAIQTSNGKTFRFEMLENGGYVSRQVAEITKPE